MSGTSSTFRLLMCVFQGGHVESCMLARKLHHRLALVPLWGYVRRLVSDCSPEDSAEQPVDDEQVLLIDYECDNDSPPAHATTCTELECSCWHHCHHFGR
jgi:hypothetical protein